MTDIIQGVYNAAQYLFKNENVYEIINLGGHSPITLKEMIQTIGATENTSSKINVVPMQPCDLEVTFANVSKAKKKP